MLHTIFKAVILCNHELNSHDNKIKILDSLVKALLKNKEKRKNVNATKDGKSR